MAQRTLDSVYNALSAISDEASIDFGLPTSDVFKTRYGSDNGLQDLYNRLAAISDEASVDFGLPSTMEEWMSSFHADAATPEKIEPIRASEPIEAINPTDNGTGMADTQPRKKSLYERLSEMGGMMAAGGGAGVPVDPIQSAKRADALEPMTEEQGQNLSDRQAAAASKRLESDYEDAVTASRRKNVFGQFFGGLWDALYDIRQWDFGVTDLLDSEAILRTMQKEEAGEELTEEESKLLDLVALKQWQEENLDMPAAYEVGKGVGDMAGYALAIATSPASGLGKAATKKAAKEMVKRNVKSRVARHIGERMAGILGSAGNAAVTTVTSGALRTADDMLDRMAGDAKYEIEITPEGYMVSYDGREGGLEASEAARKAFLSQFGSYWSEESGALLGAGGRLISKGIKKTGVGNKLANVKGIQALMETAAKMRSSDVGRVVNQFREKIKFLGSFEEFGEEQIDTILNSILVGDSSMSDLLDVRQQMITFGVVGVAAGFFDGLSAGGYAHERMSRKHMRTKTRDEIVGRGFEEEIKAIDNASDDTLPDVLTDIITRKDISRDDKVLMLRYVKNNLMIKGYDAAEAKKRMDGELPLEIFDLEDIYSNAYNSFGTKKPVYNAREVLKDLEEASKDVDVQLLESYGDNMSQFVLDMRKSGKDYTKELAYMRAKRAYDGLVDSAKDKAAFSIKQGIELTNRARYEGGDQIWTATDQQGRSLYIVKGKYVLDSESGVMDESKSDQTLTVLLPNGEKETISSASIVPTSLVTLPYDVHIAQMTDYINGEYISMLTGEMSTPTIEETKSAASLMQVGDNVTMAINGINMTANVQSFDGERYVIAFEEPVTIGDKTSATHSLTPEEAAMLLNVSSVESLNEREESQQEADKAAQAEAEAQAREEATEHLEIKDEDGTHNIDIIDNGDGTLTATEGDESINITQEQAEGLREQAVEPMPTHDVDGNQEADWLATTPERGRDYLYDESELSVEEADGIRDANIAKAEKDLETLNSQAPKASEYTGTEAYKKARSEWQAKMDEAQKTLDYWNGVKAAQDAAIAMAEEQAKQQAAQETAQETAPTPDNEMQPVEEPKAETPDKSAPQMSDEEAVAKIIERRAKMVNRAINELGLDSNLFVVVSNVDEIPSDQDEAIMTIKRGQVVEGWYKPGDNKIYLFAPHLRSVSRAKEVIMHETVAHYGIRKVNSKENYNKFLDDIWKMMSEKEKRERAQYIKQLDRPLTDEEFKEFSESKKDTRAAADEYVAKLAENTNLNPNLWKRIIEMVQEMFSRLGARFKKKEIEDMLRKSYANLKSAESNTSTTSTAAEESTGETRMSLRGEIGAANDLKAMDNLDFANQMEAQGKDAKTIWLATGWERGKDGKWRNEIPDAEGKIIYDTKDIKTLEDLVDAPELFAAYPQLKDYKVNFKFMKDAGAFSSSKNQINIDITDNLVPNLTPEEEEEFLSKVREDIISGRIAPPSTRGYRKFILEMLRRKGVPFHLDEYGMETVLHEIQHAIQQIEGFGQGGNTKIGARNLFNDIKTSDPGLWFIASFLAGNSAKKIKDLGGRWMLSMMDRYVREKSNRFGLDLDKLVKTMGEISNMDIRQYNAFVDNAKKVYNKALNVGEDYYTKLAGEVESRNVERRMSMSEEERSNTPPSETEDVPREEQIVRYRINQANALQKQPGMADDIDIPYEPETRFSLTKNNRKTISSWLDKRSDLTDDMKNALLDYLDTLNNSKMQLAIGRWYAKGTIRIPDDILKVEQALTVAEKAKVDPLRYDSPMELINSHSNFKMADTPINPDDVPTLHKAKEYPEYGLVIYDVDESQESRENMRKIINTHYGKEASPWCLLQGDRDGNLTNDSEYFWYQKYTAYQKQVAFKDGKLLAFSANDIGKVKWWDRDDESFDGIPFGGRRVDDEGRMKKTALMPNGKVELVGKLYRGNKHTGTYEEWHDNGQLKKRGEYKDAKINGLYEEWFDNGKQRIKGHFKMDAPNGLYESWFYDGKLDTRANYKDGKEDGLYESWYLDGTLEKRINYKYGVKYGTYESWYSDGRLEERKTYKDDVEDGLTEVWYPNGMMARRTNYKNGNRDGLHESWNSDGQIDERSSYKDGLKDGLHETWHDNGQLESRINYKEGDKDGISEEWDERGVLRQRSNYKNGKQEGTSIRWRGDGRMWSRSSYKNGQKDGLSEVWYSNGQMATRSEYKNGMIYGISEEWNLGGKMMFRENRHGGEVIESLPLTDDKGTPAPVQEETRFSYTTEQLRENTNIQQANSLQKQPNMNVDLSDVDTRFSLGEDMRGLANAGTIFSGGGTIEAGLKDVINPVYAVEYDEKIAGVYADNHGDHIIVADVAEVDPKKVLENVNGHVSFFHASPLCHNYSRAKFNAVETELDRRMADATANNIEALRPEAVTIENAPAYKDSESLKIILDKLDELGYIHDDPSKSIYDSADYGAATSRKRMILRAVRPGLTLPPRPAHTEKVGWYDVVKDLVKDLPKAEMTERWTKMMDEWNPDWRTLDKPVIAFGGGYGKVRASYGNEPAPTITASGQGDEYIILPGGDIRKTTPRVLARIMGLPDDYKLPEGGTLSHTIIGNGVPIKLTQAVIAPLVQSRINEHKERVAITEQIDKEYLEAARNGDMDKATELFNKYVLAQADENIVPILYAVKYRGNGHEKVSKLLKSADPMAIEAAVFDMEDKVPENAVLIPMPSHTGKAMDTKALADALGKATGVPVMDILEGLNRESAKVAKEKGHKMTPEMMGMHLTAEIPEGKIPVYVDNVIDRGTTAAAAVRAGKGGIVLAYAKTTKPVGEVILKSAQPITWDDNGRIIPLSERFNPENKDIRFSISSEIAAKYPNWMDEQITTEEDSKKGQNTQVSNTLGTYKKVGKWIGDNLDKGASILDASSGLGLGTLELRKQGFNIEDIEPYPGKNRQEPPTYGGVDAYQQAMDAGKRYDFIISNAVLNVIPDDWRDGVVHDMALLLKPGGKMFVNTRPLSSAKSIKNKVELENENEVLVGTPEKIFSYQKFFSKQELKEYMEKELGEGYTVEVANEKNSGTSGLAAVVVTKSENDTRFSIDHSKDYSTSSEEDAREQVRRTIKASMPNTKVVDKNGEPLLMSHHTDAEGFYTFDKDKIGSGQGQAFLGAGFNFSRGYGDNTYGRRNIQAYLNAEHPLRSDRNTLSRAQIRSILNELNDLYKEDKIEQNWGDMNDAVNALYNYGGDLDTYATLSMVYSGHRKDVMEVFRRRGFDSSIEYDSDGEIMNAVVFSSNQIKSADPVTYDDNGDIIPLSERGNLENDDIRFSISRRNRETISAWLNKRPDLTDEMKESLLDYLDTLDNSKMQLAIGRWYAKGTIRIPEDMPKVEQALAVADKAKVDPLKYDSPMELINTHEEFEVAETPINPDDVPTLHKAKEYPEYGVVVYDVDDSQESRENMRKIINTHYGKECSPWCLLHGDKDGVLTEDSEYYWYKLYTAYPKQVAFKDGKLLAFSANKTEKVKWWDRNDEPFEGIPFGGQKVDDQGRMRKAILMPDGSVEQTGPVYRGNKHTGTYEEWYDNGQLKEKSQYKDAKKNGLSEEWYDNGSLYIRAGYKKGEQDGLCESWYDNGNPCSRINYKEGSYHGKREEWYSDGKIRIRETYFNGKLDGLSERWHDNGHLETRATYDKGWTVGLHERWFENGQLRSKENYNENGQLEGKVELWYENGNPYMKASYKMGHRDGLYERWYENGQMTFRTTYKDRSEVGLYESWYENGILKARGHKKFDLLDGECEEWDENGNLRKKAFYVHGELDGIFEEWYNGHLIERSEWKNGEMHGLSETWYENGIPIRRGRYVNGERDGHHEEWYENGVMNFRGDYKKGKRNGLHEWWYENGVMRKRIPYKMGIIDGVVAEWLDKGELWKRTSFKDGKVENLPLVGETNTPAPTYNKDEGVSISNAQKVVQDITQNNQKRYNPTTEADDGRLMFSISRRNAETIERLLKKNPGMTEDGIAAFKIYVEHEEPVAQLAMAKWVGNGSVRLPEDKPTVDEALKICRKEKSDPMKFTAPGEIVSDWRERNMPEEVKREYLSPDNYPDVLTNKRVVGDGITIYDVANTKKGQQAVRDLMNDHLTVDGKHYNCWCLLYASESTGELSGQAWNYWNRYNGVQKKVAFNKDGQIVSFCASSSHSDEWWDLSDRSHGGLIPVEGEVPGDSLKRHSIMEVDPATGESRPVGNKYQGNKKNGLYREWNDKDVLVLSANFKGGKRDGLSEEWYNNGQMSFRANFKDGKEDGLYEKWYDNGQMESRVNYKDGKGDGLYEEWYENGQMSYHANFKDGKEDGFSEGWYENGQMLYRTNYKNGKGEGFYESWHENGQMAVHKNIKNGKYNGLSEEWHENGQIKSRFNYKDGKEEGLQEEWFDNGQMSYRRYYKDGKLDGLIEKWHDNGQMKSRANYKDGEEEGLSEIWRENGQIGYRTNYKDGKEEGLSEVWYDDGQIRYRTNYKNGKKDGISIGWHENGQISYRINYKDDELDGLYEEWYENGQMKYRRYYKDDAYDDIYEVWDSNGQMRGRALYKDGQYVANLPLTEDKGTPAPTYSEEEARFSIAREKVSFTMMDAAEMRSPDIRFSISTEPDLMNLIKEFSTSTEAKRLKWTPKQVVEIAEETSSLINFLHSVISGDPNYDEFSKKRPTMVVDWRDGITRPIVTWVRNNIEYKYDMSADTFCVNNEGIESILAEPAMIDLMKAITKYVVSEKKKGHIKTEKSNRNVGFNSEDNLRLYNVLDDLGIVVSCKGCFDAAARFKMLASTAQKFTDLVNSVIAERNKDPKAFDDALRNREGEKTPSGLPAKASTKEEAVRIGVAGDNLTEPISWTQLMSAKGQTKALTDWGGIFRAWQRTGAGRPKDKLLPEPYTGQIVSITSTIIAPYGEKTPSFRDLEVNTGTGLRRNSHSEFRPTLAVDEFQFMRDAWLKKLCVFKYMKELDDVRLFGKMGVKFNMSAFAAWEKGSPVAGLKVDGSYAIADESVGGREFPYKDKDGKTRYDGYKGLEEAQKHINKDVSLSLVVFSVPHLIKALTDVPTPSDKRGLWGSLIPFHASGATAMQLMIQGLGMARGMKEKSFLKEAFSDYGKGVTNFEQVQNDRYGEGYVVILGKDKGKSATGHKLEYPDARVLRNESMGVTIYRSAKAYEDMGKDMSVVEGVSGVFYTLDSEDNKIAHPLVIDYNDKVRELKGDKYAYKTASDYYVETLRKIGIIPRFDFEVPEDVFLQMCEDAKVDPNHPKLGWKGKGHSWTPADAESYYSVWCDFGMTDPETGYLSPHMPVLHGQTAADSFEKALPENYSQIIKEGLERYTSRRKAEDALTNDAILEYAKRSVAEGRLPEKEAKAILDAYGIGKDKGETMFSIGQNEDVFSAASRIASEYKAKSEAHTPVKEEPKAKDDIFSAASRIASEYREGKRQTPVRREPKGKTDVFSKAAKRAADLASERDKEAEEAMKTLFSINGDPDGEIAKDYYTKAVNDSLKYKLHEGYVDSMLSVLRLQEAVMAEVGGKLEDFENVYMAENLKTSRDKQRKEMYHRDYMVPIYERMAEVIKKMKEEDSSLTTEAAQEKLEKYLIARHGIERNIRMSFLDSLVGLEESERRNLEEAFMAEAEIYRGWMTHTSYASYIEELMNAAKRLSPDPNFTVHDYSGLTELFGYNKDAKDVSKRDDKMSEAIMNDALDIVTEMEAVPMVTGGENQSENKTKKLWEAINRATKQQLIIQRNAGLMTRDQYEKISRMYTSYIPLRGWDDEVAHDRFTYINNFESPYRSTPRAKGRQSRAFSPIANIGYMAQNIISSANRNEVRQHLLNLARDKQTSLMTVKNTWLVKVTDANGDERWEISVPHLSDDMTPEEVVKAIEDHEADMQEKKKNKMARQSRRGLDLGLIALPREVQQHAVVVYEGGTLYTVFINGNPRAAQAINGLTNNQADQSSVTRAIGEFNRFLSKNFTSRNPAFILTNMMRDINFAVEAVTLKEDKQYFKAFMRNLGRDTWETWYLVAKAEKGTLNPNNPEEKLFLEFLEDGGETGYTEFLRDKDFDKMMRKMVKESVDGKSFTTYANVFKWIGAGVDYANRAAETMTRFTAYRTSREMGRTRQKSAYDAKEITVNFNKKGSGIAGANFFRSLYIFFNAGVQGLNNQYKLFKKNPALAFVKVAKYMAMGAALPLVQAFIASMYGDGDDDEREEYLDTYFSLPDYVRRSNLCIYMGDGRFVKIPLAIEWRAAYGLGDIMLKAFSGRSRYDNVALDVVDCVADLVPINPMAMIESSDPSSMQEEFALDFMATAGPDALRPFFQLGRNRDFFGSPIYREPIYPNQEYRPRWQNVYGSTKKLYVQTAEALSRATGGDDYKKGVVDINPAVPEHLLESFLGGFYTFWTQLANLGYNAFSGKKTEMSNMPIVNRFLQDANEERSLTRSVNNAYYHYKDAADETSYLLKRYQKAAKTASPEEAAEYEKKISELESSTEAQLAELVKEAEDEIRDIKKMFADYPEEISTQTLAVKQRLVKNAERLINR